MSELLGSTPLAYPLSLRFKMIAISNQFALIDNNERTLGYVRQPWMKIKESVSVYADDSLSTLLYTIKADRILDMRAKYTIADAQGRTIGQLQRHMMKSFFKSTYSLSVVQTDSGDSFGQTAGTHVAEYSVSETNPWIKFVDGLVSNIPVLGVLTGYFLHPRYAIMDASGVERLEFRKRPSLIERRFDITALEGLPSRAERPLILAAMMIILLEANRG